MMAVQAVVRTWSFIVHLCACSEIRIGCARWILTNLTGNAVASPARSSGALGAYPCSSGARCWHFQVRGFRRGIIMQVSYVVSTTRPVARTWSSIVKRLIELMSQASVVSHPGKFSKLRCRELVEGGLATRTEHVPTARPTRPGRRRQSDTRRRVLWTAASAGLHQVETAGSADDAYRTAVILPTGTAFGRGHRP